MNSLHSTRQTIKKETSCFRNALQQEVFYHVENIADYRHLLVFIFRLGGLLDPQSVAHQRDKLPIRRLIVKTAHISAERLVKRLRVQKTLQGIKE